MSNSSGNSWSQNPNAPQIPYSVYGSEKSNFAGVLISAMLYGIVIILFFKCIGASLNPVNRARGSIKWGLVIHTALMFSLATINTAMTFNFQSISYIDNRAFPGTRTLYRGPFEYQLLIGYKPIAMVPNLMYQLNQWLADALLLYRCYIVCGMNYWIIALPCLMYLASLATGIFLAYLDFGPNNYSQNFIAMYNFNMAYFTISLALNVLLTLMIATRLILHARNMQRAMGAQVTGTKLYQTIAIMLIESFALYSILLLVFTILDATSDQGAVFLNQTIPMAQVIAPFLIIVRVAKQRAVTSEDVRSGNIDSMRFGSQGESTYNDGPISDVDLVDGVETEKETPREPSVGDTVTGDVSR